MTADVTGIAFDNSTATARGTSAQAVGEYSSINGSLLGENAISASGTGASVSLTGDNGTAIEAIGTDSSATSVDSSGSAALAEYTGSQHQQRGGGQQRHTRQRGRQRRYDPGRSSARDPLVTAALVPRCLPVGRGACATR